MEGLPSAETILAAAGTAAGRRADRVDRGVLHVTPSAVIADEVLNVRGAVGILEGDMSAAHLLRRAPHNLKSLQQTVIVQVVNMYLAGLSSESGL